VDLFRRLFSSNPPADSSRTVFISYRRDVSAFIARAIFQDLRAHGYDVFMDVESIDAGDFGSIILNQIAARAHFVLILSPGTLERCAQPDDWLRREIEYAIDLGRNIVPLMTSNFNFKAVSHFLTGKLSQLPSLNALEVNNTYFDAGMEKLRTRFLQQPAHGKILPTPTPDRPVIERTIEVAAKQPKPTTNELKAEEAFSLGYSKQKANELDAAIGFYDIAISLNPAYSKAFYNRGLAYYTQRELDKAIANYGQAIKADAQYAKAYHNRGLAWYEKGELAQAIEDYNRAIALNADYTIAYNNRGNALTASKQFKAAIADYQKYLELKGGIQYGNQRDVEVIIRDLQAWVESGQSPDAVAQRFTNLSTGTLPAVPGAGTAMVDTETSWQPSSGEVQPAMIMDNETTPPMPFYSVADGATRGLPTETVTAESNNSITFGQATDVGMVRNDNQDGCWSFLSVGRTVHEQPDFGLFMVADGMGGHLDGEKASAVTIQTTLTEIMHHVYLPMISAADDADRPTITEALTAAVQKANTELLTNVPESGSTLTAAVIIGNLAYIAHVGDSRAYLITRNDIEQMTRDHSLVMRLIELDQLTPEEAALHPQKNVLYRALGQSENLDVDTLTRRLPPDSSLLLCSDGLWGMVTEAEIRDLVKSSHDPQEACDKLVALANTRGGTDNITAILVKMPS
jgi:serine/threonine protein phosphatase PrpC/tetratricopeptide (TPR) repeat protein